MDPKDLQSDSESFKKPDDLYSSMIKNDLKKPKRHRLEQSMEYEYINVDEVSESISSPNDSMMHEREDVAKPAVLTVFTPPEESDSDSGCEFDEQDIDEFVPVPQLQSALHQHLHKAVIVE